MMFYRSRVVAAGLSALLWCVPLISYGQGVIGNGASPTASIFPVGNIDQWTFSASAGDTILVQIGELTGTNFEPEIRLYDPLAALVASDWSSISAALSHQATLTGTYTIEVDDATTVPNGTGDYQLYLQKIPGAFSVPVGDEGGALSNGESHAGDIDLGDIDTWTFFANAADTVLIQAAETADNGGFDPQLILYDPFGNQLASNWGSTATDLREQLSISGLYTVVLKEATSSAPSSGSYSLYFTNVGQVYSVPVGDEGGSLTNGGVHAGDIDLADIDIWTFTADANDTVLIQAGQTVDDGGFDPELRLYDSEGNQLASNWGTDATDLRVQLAVGGEYTVVVKEATNNVPSTGSYNLYFTNIGQPLTVPGGDQGGALTNGGIHPGSIELADIDSWQFTADANDTVLIQAGQTIDNGGFDPELRLYNPSGEQVASNWGTDATDLRVQLEVGGEYTVVVKEATNNVPSTGSYNLYFTNIGQPLTVPGGDEGGALSNGDVHAGSIDLADIDSWHFTAEANDTVLIQAGQTIDNGGFDPELRLYNPSGEQVASNWGTTATDLRVQLEVGGEYTVVVKEATNNVPSTGSYNLFFTNAGPGITVPAGDEGGVIASGVQESGAITLADIDSWTFAVDALDQIDLTVTEVIDDGGFEAEIALIDPLGNQLDVDWGATTATISLTAPIGGDYVVTVREATSNVPSTGTYLLDYTLTPASVSVPAGSIIASLSNGGVVSGTFADSSDIDKYDVSLVAGQHIRIQVGDLANTGNNAPIVNVFDPSGDLVAADTHGNIAAIQLIASATGTYTVALQNSVTTASPYDYVVYTAISQQSFAVPGGDEGGALGNGSASNGSLPVGDLDLYSLAINAGDQVRLRLGDVSSTGNFTPVLEVYRADGSLLIQNQQGNVADTSFIAASSETLTVLVRNATRVQGTYSYALHTAVGKQGFVVPAGDQGGALANGGEASGSLSVGDTDLYTLAVDVGDQVRLRVGDVSSTGNFTPAMQVYRSDGSLLAQDSHGWVANTSFIATAAETLTVVLRNDVLSLGNYDYALHTAVSKQAYVVPAGDEGGALVNGDIASGVLSVADLDLYSLAVKTGDNVRLQLGDVSSTGNFTPALQVYDAAGNLLADNFDGAVSNVDFTAGSDETLMLVLRNNVRVSGNYNYALHAAVSAEGFGVPLADEGGELLAGVTENGSLSVADMDIYSLSVSAGDLLTITVVDEDATGNNAPGFRVFDKDANLLALDAAGGTAEVTFSAPATEALQIVVRNAVLVTGDYDYSIVATGANSAVDTDGDGLSDADEVANVTNINEPDTDGDGLTDGEEVNTYATDPSSADSDGDTFTDFEEIVHGSDPNDQNSVPPVDVNIPLPQWALWLAALALIQIAAQRKRKLT